ncbi:MAG: hypothetical protein ABI832_10605 [bacterium]
MSDLLAAKPLSDWIMFSHRNGEEPQRLHTRIDEARTGRQLMQVNTSRT